MLRNAEHFSLFLKDFSIFLGFRVDRDIGARGNLVNASLDFFGQVVGFHDGQPGIDQDVSVHKELRA